MAERAKAKKASASGGSTARGGKQPETKRAKTTAAARPQAQGHPARVGAAASEDTAAGVADRIAHLETEAQALRQQLAAAQAHISRLERRQELVVNRIDWVIDSLHNLIEGED